MRQTYVELGVVALDGKRPSRHLLGHPNASRKDPARQHKTFFFERRTAPTMPPLIKHVFCKSMWCLQKVSARLQHQEGDSALMFQTDKAETKAARCSCAAASLYSITAPCKKKKTTRGRHSSKHFFLKTRSNNKFPDARCGIRIHVSDHFVAQSGFVACGRFFFMRLVGAQSESGDSRAISVGGARPQRSGTRIWMYTRSATQLDPTEKDNLMR